MVGRRHTSVSTLQPPDKAHLLGQQAGALLRASPALPSTWHTPKPPRQLPPTSCTQPLRYESPGGPRNLNFHAPAPFRVGSLQTCLKNAASDPSLAYTPLDQH